MNINTFNIRRIFSPRILAGAIGIILITAAALKTYDIELFMRQIRDYQIITNDALIILAAWCLIITEFVLGASLITYYLPGITVSLSVALFCVFIGATMWAWVTGVTEDCGCFGSWVKRSPAGATIEDLFMLSALLLSWPRGGRPSESENKFKPLIVIAALAAGIALPLVFGAPVKELVGLGNTKTADGKDLFTLQGLKDIDLKKGSYLFVVIGTDCGHCRDSVETFNRLTEKSDLPSIIGLSADTREMIDGFIYDLGPKFPVLSISEDDFYRLLGMGATPRSILVNKQHIIKTWDEEVPTASAIMEALEK